MKLTALDIQQKDFSRALRGYEREEVRAFLQEVAAEVEELSRKLNALGDELRRRDERLAEYAEREKNLQETLLTAQRITEEIKHASRKEAEIIIAEAEVRAEKIVQNAHTRLVEVIDQINEMKRQRAQFESQLRSTIESHAKLLAVFADERQESVKLLKASGEE